MRHKYMAWSGFIVFLLGLGSETKTYFYGCLAFSELAVFFIAPIVFVKNYKELRFCGLMLPVKMILGLMAALIVSSLINRTAYPFVVKSFAVMYAVLSYYIVFSVLLKSNPKGLRWFFVGYAISIIITIFAFNPQAIVVDSGSAFIGQADSEAIIGGPLFWIQRVKALGQIPIIGWYLKIPLGYSVLTPIAFTVFAMLTTVSGRSASISVLIAGTLMLLGRKSCRQMRQLGRHMILFAVLGCLIVFGYKLVYSYAARHGLLSQDAQTKYEKQTDNGSDIISLLISGRKEFFMAIPAALDRPIFGYGPYAEDKGGYALKFMAKYGDANDLAAYQYSAEVALRNGAKIEIPCHSHIMGAWVHYGIFGLIFYVWFLVIMFQQIKYHMAAIPQWFGYFSLTLGTYFWHIMFSPPGNRATLGLFIAALFISRAVSNGRILLPFDVEAEARKYA